jgi:hypothetical protein
LLRQTVGHGRQGGHRLNRLNSTSVAEKLSALRTEDYFRERAVRADIPEALRILARAGGDSPPVPGDEAE